MFGYVSPAKPEMRIREFQLYKTVYCSLCRELQRGFGVFAKMLLNYDFVFLALVGILAKGEPLSAFDGRCTTNPFRRQAYLPDSPSVRHSAACLVIASYHKLSDDRADETFFKKARAVFLQLLLWRAYRKARRKLPGIDRAVTENMAAQRVLEAEHCGSYDIASAPSADSLSAVCAALSDDRDTRRVLSRLGYFAGRFVYLADAGDDLKEDLSRRRYNPAACKHRLTDGDDLSPCLEEIRGELSLARGEIAACYNLLPALPCCREILDNIIFLGLPETIRQIGTEKKGTPFHDRSL